MNLEKVGIEDRNIAAPLDYIEYVNNALHCKYTYFMQVKKIREKSGVRHSNEKNCNRFG